MADAEEFPALLRRAGVTPQTRCPAGVERPVPKDIESRPRFRRNELEPSGGRS